MRNKSEPVDVVRRLVTAGWGVAAICIGAAASAENWPRVKAAPGATLQWVAQEMVHNGVPMQIQTFQANTPPRDVIAFYRQEWSARGARPPVENASGEWQIIGQRQGDYYITVQARAGGGASAQGYIAVTQLSAAGKSKLPHSVAAFPSLGGTQVISQSQADDGGKKSVTLVLRNGFSMESNSGFYRATFSGEGWTLLQDFDPASQGMTGRVMYFERRGESCHISMSSADDGSTVIAVNQVHTTR